MNQKTLFDGLTIDPDQDNQRLGDQSHVVFDLMADGIWRTLRSIEDITGYPQASVSARLRDFRKEKFGGHKVERKRMDGGLFVYRLIKK